MTFMYRQTGNLGMLMLVIMAWRQLPKLARAAVREAWRHGRKAETFLTQPLSDIRKSLGIAAPPRYQEAERKLFSIG